MVDWTYVGVVALCCIAASLLVVVMHGASMEEERRALEPESECYLCGSPIRESEGYRHIAPDSKYLIHTICPDEGEDDEPRYPEQRPA